MAIINITDLTEVQSSALTDNDFLAVGTSTGWKKIKANSLGGGGGAEELVVEFTGDPSSVTSITTYAQIVAAFEAGKNVRGVWTSESTGSMLFRLANVFASEVVFAGEMEISQGSLISCTIRGSSSGYSFYSYQ